MKCTHPVLYCAAQPPHCIIAFSDMRSVVEYEISGLCQHCQDELFPDFKCNQERYLINGKSFIVGT